jgi:hypothetical protein
MTEELTITFYKIYKCGFYKKNKNQFGSIQEILPQLRDWAVSVKRMYDTQLFDTSQTDETSPVDTDIRNVFYYDFCSKDGSSLLVLWNQLLDIDGEVPTLSKDKEIGDNIKCELTELPENAIPGTSSYFWFLPEKGYFASVARKSRTSNVAGMKLYLEKFLALRSPYCVLESDSKEIQIIGYKKPSDTKLQTDITPYFQAKRALQKGQIEFIQSNRTKIRKVIRKQRLIKNSKPRYDTIKQLLINIGLKSPQKVKNNPINTTYEISYTPTDEELKTIIKNWEDENITTFDDTGFVLSGESGKKHWLSGEISRIKKDLPVSLIDDEIIDPRKLLRILNENREELLEVLP